MILLFAAADDPVAHAGERELRRRDFDVARWDAGSFPATTSLTMHWDARGRRRRCAVAGGREIALDDVRAVWHRRMAAGIPDQVTDPRQRRFIDLESRYVLEELANDLHVPFVPAPWAQLRTQQAKLMQLTLAGSLGFELPPSIVTTDPDELAAFYRAHDGRVITKHADPWSLEQSGLTRELRRFTQRVSRRERAQFDRARLCPVFAQAYVPKRLELRVTVVGDQIFAAEIDSQRSQRTATDWRHQDSSVAIRAHALPVAIADRCRAMTRALGLRYGAFDLVLTPDGRHVFLEINPGGEFHWIEVQTGLPITRAIVDLLADLARPAHRSVA